MSAWLSEWLRDIVLIILFAAFVDLLIPNNSLQRYVKVVISLMIMLTILSPVIALLRSDVNWTQAIFAAAGRSAGTLPPLPEVLEAGGKLRLEAEARSVQIAERQLADLIRERVAQAFLTDAAVSVRIKPAEDGGAIVEVVRLRLSGAEEDAQQGGADVRQRDPPAVTPVEPVEPVSISVGRRGEAARDAVAADQGTREKTPEQLLLEDRIRRHLRDWLAIDERIIDIDWGNGG